MFAPSVLASYMKMSLMSRDAVLTSCCLVTIVIEDARSPMLVFRRLPARVFSE